MAQQPNSQEFKLVVPTYNAALFFDDVSDGRRPEFGAPELPVLVRESAGVRIVLGTHDWDDYTKPDVQIERQPLGWVVFLHPLGGSDASGYVYMLDDGRSFLLRENAVGPTPALNVLSFGERLPEVHGLERPLRKASKCPMP